MHKDLDETYITTEVFHYTDDTGVERWIAIEPLRRWAEANCKISSVPIDIRKVEDMFANKRIDESRLRDHTMQRQPRPIIICDDFFNGLSEIIDGNHTYVAMATFIALAEQEGLNMPGPIGVPAYIITHSQMEQFLIPPEALRKKQDTQNQ